MSNILFTVKAMLALSAVVTVSDIASIVHSLVKEQYIRHMTLIIPLPQVTKLNCVHVHALG